MFSIKHLTKCFQLLKSYGMGTLYLSTSNNLCYIIYRINSEDCFGIDEHNDNGVVYTYFETSKKVLDMIHKWAPTINSVRYVCE